MEGNRFKADAPEGSVERTNSRTVARRGESRAVSGLRDRRWPTVERRQAFVVGGNRRPPHAERTPQTLHAKDRFTRQQTTRNVPRTHPQHRDIAAYRCRALTDSHTPGLPASQHGTGYGEEPRYLRVTQLWD
jgi:hypothetical protein